MSQPKTSQNLCFVVPLLPVRIGYAQTSLSVSESESDILLEIQLLEGTIAPELGNIVVTVSTSDQTALGGSLNILLCECGHTYCAHSTFYMHTENICNAI